MPAHDGRSRREREGKLSGVGGGPPGPQGERQEERRRVSAWYGTEAAVDVDVARARDGSDGCWM